MWKIGSCLPPDFLSAFSFYRIPKVHVKASDLTGTTAPSYWILNGPSDAASHLCVKANAALSHTHICRKVGVRGMPPTRRRQRFNHHGGLIITSPAGRCQVHLCSSPTAPLVWNAARSAAVLSHAAPRPSAQCFTILIQRETFSQLLLFPSLCFGADLKKKREEINETKDKLDPSISKPICSFLKR